MFYLFHGSHVLLMENSH